MEILYDKAFVSIKDINFNHSIQKNNNQEF